MVRTKRKKCDEEEAKEEVHLRIREKGQGGREEGTMRKRMVVRRRKRKRRVV